MTSRLGPAPRDARVGDTDQLLPLWGLLFGETPDDSSPWREHARTWFSETVSRPALACFPVVEVDDTIVACAVGTLEQGVSNPRCERGRVVRLANVVTLPGCRGRGHGTALVDFVVGWARSVRADRVDLSATAEGVSLYARSGFVPTSAPRLKLVLESR